MYKIELIKHDIETVQNIIFSKVLKNNSQFFKDIEEYLKAPSKLLRSKLCLIFAKTINSNIDEKLYLTAAAIELAHNASLLHDDVIDDADIRRSIKSFNLKTNFKTAILAGDWIISKIMQILNMIGNAEIYHAFANTFEKMALGETLEFYSRYDYITLDEYYKKNDYKTGELIKLAVSAPYILNNEPQKAEKAKIFAKYYANAFQIKDDILNYFNINDNKPTNTDKEQGIYTLPEIIKKSNSSANLYEESCQILRHQVNLSLESLEFLKDSEYKEVLISLCEDLLKGI